MVSMTSCEPITSTRRRVTSRRRRRHLVAAVGTLVAWIATLRADADPVRGPVDERVCDPAEPATMLRLLHDTVLQTLETMARPSELDGTEPAERLRELRCGARQQADRLRRAMAELTDGPAGSLTAGLHGVADEFVPAGLRAQVIAAADLPELPAWQRGVLRDGVRAALGNVLKHAGVDRAVVRIEPSGGGVRVVVRDRGRGFDPALTAPGFGIRQSITARLREVGGRSTITSSTGAGTRVELWVPG